jgi:hypothetical protein
MLSTGSYYALVQPKEKAPKPKVVKGKTARAGETSEETEADAPAQAAAVSAAEPTDSVLLQPSQSQPIDAQMESDVPMTSAEAATPTLLPSSSVLTAQSSMDATPVLQASVPLNVPLPVRSSAMPTVSSPSFAVLPSIQSQMVAGLPMSNFANPFVARVLPTQATMPFQSQVPLPANSLQQLLAVFTQRMQAQQAAHPPVQTHIYPQQLELMQRQTHLQQTYSMPTFTAEQQHLQQSYQRRSLPSQEGSSSKADPALAPAPTSVEPPSPPQSDPSPSVPSTPIVTSAQPPIAPPSPALSTVSTQSSMTTRAQARSPAFRATLTPKRGERPTTPLSQPQESMGQHVSHALRTSRRLTEKVKEALVMREDDEDEVKEL